MRNYSQGSLSSKLVALNDQRRRKARTMRDVDPFRFRNDSAWVKLIAWLLLQVRLAISAVCLAACLGLGAANDVAPLIKKAIQALAA